MYPQITLHYSRYFFLPTLHTLSFSLLLPLSIYFFSDAFHPLPAVAWTIKILCVINKIITHRNPFARSADVNRRSILNARGAGRRREVHEDRKEGRKRDTVTIISGTDVRGDSIIVVSVTFDRAAVLHAWRFIPDVTIKTQYLHFAAGQCHLYLCNCKPCTMRIIQRNRHATGIIRDNYL